MRPLAALSLAFLAAGPAGATEPLMPPRVVAETFCLARTSGDMSFIEPYLSDDLSFAIGKAMAVNHTIEEANPGEKPPLGDGIPWASYQDAAQDCAVDYDAAQATPEAVPVAYGFDDAPDAGWTDTLVLKLVGEAWKLDDVLYQDGGRLRAVLTSIAMFNELAAAAQ